MKITGGSYAAYRESAPFLFPLPKWLNRILGWPGRLVTKGEYPGSTGQVLWIVLIYTVMLMALSLFWMDPGGSSRKSVASEEAKQELNVILEKLEDAGDKRREIYALIDQIPEHGQAGKECINLPGRKSQIPKSVNFPSRNWGSWRCVKPRIC